MAVFLLSIASGLRTGRSLLFSGHCSANCAFALERDAPDSVVIVQEFCAKAEPDETGVIHNAERIRIELYRALLDFS